MGDDSNMVHSRESRNKAYHEDCDENVGRPC